MISWAAKVVNEYHVILVTFEVLLIDRSFISWALLYLVNFSSAKFPHFLLWVLADFALTWFPPVPVCFLRYLSGGGR